MAADARFHTRYGPWAVVAGGSMGMGAAYARQLAARGLSVAVVADAAHPPDEIARRLAAEHGVETRAVTADLAATDVLAPMTLRPATSTSGSSSTTPPTRSSAGSSTSRSPTGSACST